MEIRFNGSTRNGRYPFLSNAWPSPFILDGIRWRTIDHYMAAMRATDPIVRRRISMATSAAEAILMGANISEDLIDPHWHDEAPISTTEIGNALGKILTVEDATMFQGLMAKFGQDPALIRMLRSTAPFPIVNDDPNPYWGSNTNMLGRMLVLVRARLVEDAALTENDILFANLYRNLSGQGYRYIVSVNGNEVQIPIEEGPRESFTGMVVRKPSSAIAIVDVYLEGTYPESRLKEVIDLQETMGTKGGKPVYILVAYLTRSSMARILRKIRDYDPNIYFSPSSLYLRASEHILTPHVDVVREGDDDWNIVSQLKGGRLGSEIDRDDLLVKEMGLNVGTIIRVHDFSPHYRVVT